MSNKEIKIRWVSDETEINNSIERMKTRLQQMNEVSSKIQGVTASGGTLSKRASMAQKSFQQSSVSILQKEAREIEIKARKENMILLQKQRELKKILSSEEAITAEKKKQIDLLNEEIASRSKSVLSLETARHEINRRTEQISGEAPQGPTMNLGRMSNYRGLRRMGFGRGTSRMLSSFGGPAAVLGGAAAIGGYGLRLGTSVWDELAEKERNIIAAQGSAFSRGSRALREQMSGRGVESAIFGEERQRALTMAGNEMSSRRSRDVLKTIGSAIESGLKGAVGGALTGGALGAGIGSIIPGAGTLAGGMAGAGWGAIRGGIAGLGMGVLGTALNKQSRGAILGTQEYYTGITAEGMRQADENEKRLRLLNWQKSSAYEDLQKNMGLYNNASRLFGTANPLEEGGMLRRMADLGISRRTGMSLSAQMIQQSGLSNLSAEEVRNSYMMQQGGLTNAPRVVGAIRGIAKGFGEQATDESMKKLFTAAVRAGLDSSKKIEQLRQFSSVSAEMAMKSGVRVEEAASELAKATIGEGAVNLTAAKNAIAAREQMSGTRGGAALQRKFAYANSAEGREELGGVAGDVYDIAQLSTLRMSQISEDNPVVQDLMKKMGIDDIEEFKRRKTKLDLVGGVARGSTRRMFSQLTEKIKDLTPEQATKSFMSGGENADLYATLAGRLNVESSTFAGLSTFRDKMALISSLARGQGKGTAGAISKEEIAKLKGQPGGMLIRPDLTGESANPLEAIIARGEEGRTTQFEKARAADEAVTMGRLSKHIDKFADQAKNMSQNAVKVSDAMEALRAALDSGASDVKGIFEEMKRKLAIEAPTTQGNEDFRFFMQKPEPSANNGE